MSAVGKRKIKLREVNRHLVCRLCRGYYVDATTIAECLHSFCRSCIIRYLEKNSFCPICEVQIHTTKPYLSLRQDKALQDVVYKLVPGLYHNEMQRRRDFYAESSEQVPAATPEQYGIEDRIIFSPDEIISLSLERLEREEYIFENFTRRTEAERDADAEGGNMSVVPQQLVLKKLRWKAACDQESGPRPRRYLRCPAAVDVSHLKKFIRMKYDLGDKCQVDVIHKRVSLPDHYTLMDVAYIYTWKRNGPMRLFYYYADKMERAKVSLPSESTTTAGEVKGNAASPVNGCFTPDADRNPSGMAVISCPNDSTCDNAAEPKKELSKADEAVVGGDTSEVASANVSAPVEKRENAPGVGSETKTNPSAESENAAVSEEKPSGKPSTAESVSVPLKCEEEKSPVKDEEVLNGMSKKDEKPKKTIANLLKNYRKESAASEGRVSVENDSVVTMINASKRESSVERKEADVTIEIKSETKASEYDFESNSPPGKIVSLREFTMSEQCKNRKPQSENAAWISLQDLRKVMKENGVQNLTADCGNKPSKKRTVPVLKRIEENGKTLAVKSNGKTEDRRKSPTIINIHTEEEDFRKKENRAEAAKEVSPPRPAAGDSGNGKAPAEPLLEKVTGSRKREAPEPETAEVPPKKPKAEAGDCGAMDLSRSDTGNKTPPEASDASKKNDENMVEALISAAQKQNIEPLLRVPQFMKTCGSPPKITPGRNISPSDISQALQFFKDLRSDIRVLEAKAQLSSHSEQFSQKLNSSPFQLYQQQMDLIKKLKKHHLMANEYQQTPKTSKASPPSEKQKKSPTGEKPKSSISPQGKEDAPPGKSPVERALTQIQEQFELQNRMKQNLKNLPALLQFYNRPPFLYCPTVSPTKPNQSKMKSPSLSPNLQKSPKSPPSNLPLSMTSPGSSFFGGQSFSPMVNSGLTSEMTFHQMFQNYLSQQEKMNQIKAPLPASRPRHTPPTSSPEFFLADSKQKT